MYELKLDLVSTTALAVVLLLAGYRLKHKVKFFETFCIPAPVIGGFAMSLLVWALRETGIATIGFDTTLQGPFMIAFFTTVALSSATFGLIIGGVLGGPIANWLIQRHKLDIVANKLDTTLPAAHDHEDDVRLASHSLIATMGLVLTLMVLGLWIASAFEGASGFVLPGYVGAMFAAILFRNLNDRLRVTHLNSAAIDTVSDISLGIFLTMAMMSLKIWELYDLALPLIGVLTLQVLALVALTVFVAFRLLGRDYDAAVMCAGMIGHGLGATPNAVANMSAVCQRYGVTSYKAFMIIPLCGAVLIDLVAIPFHTWILNYLG